MFNRERRWFMVGASRRVAAAARGGLAISLVLAMGVHVGLAQTDSRAAHEPRNQLVTLFRGATLIRAR